MKGLAPTRFDTKTLTDCWERLHVLDCEPIPEDPNVLAGWALFHSGLFEEAELAGVSAGRTGLSLANRAATAYAALVETGERVRMDLFRGIHARASAHVADEPNNPNAWFWQGYALWRVSQGIHVARALAQGLGTQISSALSKAIQLAPGHVYAHLALGAFQVEVIDKVGPLIGAMTYGVQADTAVKHYREAMRIAPDSAAAMVAFADALITLEGESRVADSTQLYEQAANVHPRDAVEGLWVQLAKAGLAL